MSKKLPFSNQKGSKKNSDKIIFQNNIERMREKLYRLQYVTTALSKEPTIKEIAHIIVTLSVASMSADGGTIWIYNEQGKLELTAQTGYTKEQLETMQEIVETEDNPIQDAVRLKRNIINHCFDETKTLYPHTVKFSQSTQTQSFIAMPLLSGKYNWGAIGLSFKEENIIEPEELEYVSTLIKQCTEAIQRAKYFQEDQLQKKELKIAVERLKALQDVTEHLSDAKTLEETGYVIVTKSVKVLGAKAGEIVLLSEDNKKFYIPTYYGFPDWYMKDITNSYMPLDYEAELFILDASKTGQPIFISKWADVPKEYNHFFDVMKVIDCQSSVYLPLIIHNKVIGVMDFSFTEEKVFDKQEKDFMMTLAENCAQALDRAFGYQKIKAYADEIEKKEAKFRALIENSSDVISLLDEEGHTLYVSNSVQKVSGEVSEDVTGQSAFEPIYDEDREKVMKSFQFLLKSRLGKIQTVVYRRIKPDGSLQWIESTGSNFIKDPLIGAIVVNSRDVTERVETEVKLKESRDELKIILESITDAVVARNPSGDIVFANKAAAKLNRYQSIDELKRNFSSKNYIARFSEVTDENGNALPLEGIPSMQALKEKKMIFRTIKCVYKKTNEEQWRHVVSVPIVDTKGKLNLVISVTQDITEEKQKERLKDEFISTASHELKTPITSASLYAGILQKHLQEVRDEKGYATLSKVDGQLRRLTKLINDLLDVSKINTGGIHMKKEDVVIDDLIAEVAEEMQYTTITHKLVVQGESKKMIFVDKERIREVLVNLISNAIKYSPASKEVKILVENKKKEVEICVKDYGVGIRPENQEKIFEPFYRESHKSGARFPGLGLGLHISSQIIKMHGGKFWVDSLYGKGSKFCILLPIVQI